MGLDVCQITHWLMLSGRGHILVSREDGFNYTACGTWTNGGEIVQDEPARKCRKCLGKLPHLSKPENHGDYSAAKENLRQFREQVGLPEE